MRPANRRIAKNIESNRNKKQIHHEYCHLFISRICIYVQTNPPETERFQSKEEKGNENEGDSIVPCILLVNMCRTGDCRIIETVL